MDFFIYDEKGNLVTKSNLYDFDYNLEIDFEKHTYDILLEILELLYKLSTECYSDIIKLSYFIISEIDRLKYDIRKKEYSVFNKLVHKLFKILDIIGNVEEKMRIYTDYNKYIRGVDNSDINPVSPVSSPQIKTPGYLKKPIKKFINRINKD